MGGVGVHTPDLPNSIAWLSPKEELTFGDIDHTTQLRWFTLGREYSALHTCFHLILLTVAALHKCTCRALSCLYMACKVFHTSHGNPTVDAQMGLQMPAPCFHVRTC